MEKHIEDKLKQMEAGVADLESRMALPEVVGNPSRAKKLGREYREKRELLDIYSQYTRAERQRAEAAEMAADEQDPDMAAMARSEMRRLEQDARQLEERIKIALLPKDESEHADAVVEIRAGAGGDEAGIFASDLRRMYFRYAERSRWSVTELNSVESSVGAIKETTFQISGTSAYQRLRMESGVHRVQRVPVTESQGRIHTSTATVAVLPKAEETDITIADDELKTDIFHASGHGGQNVNKVATAVRLTHLPTGIVVVCQKERSQLQNRLLAMDILRARLWDLEIERKRAERDADRRAQIGSGDRSEKVRTYNFPQSRVSDHRINFTTHRLREVLDGEVDEIIDALLAEERALALAAQ